MPSYDASLILVDDFRFMRKILGQMLEQLGYENIRNAEDGVMALNLLREEPADLVISDYDMPNMNGIQLCEAMRNDPKLAHIPLLLISGDELEQHRSTAEKAGIREWLQKPFRATELDQTIQSLLANLSS